MESPAEVVPGATVPVALAPAVAGFASAPAPAPPARPVLAAVRAGLWGLGVEFLWVGWFLIGAQLLATVLVVVPAILLSWEDLSFPRRLTTAWLESALGPVPSLIPVAQVVAICAYLGWYLPGRIMVATGWEPADVRRTVAWIGLAGGSLLVWLLPMGLDVVMAIGFMLAPVAFAAAALRAPVPPARRLNRRAYYLFAGLLVIVNVAVVLLLLNLPVRSIALDLSAAGEPMAAVGIDPQDLEVDHWDMTSARGAKGASWTTTVDVFDPAVPIVEGFATISVAVWPAAVQDGVMQLAGPPIATTEGAVPLRHDRLEWVMPTPRARVLVVPVTLRGMPDRRRILLDADPDPGLTPPWHGPILLWWLGG